MNTYSNAKKVWIGRLSWIGIAVLVLMVVGLTIALCVPKVTDGSKVIVEQKGKIVASFDLDAESRVVRYSGVEVRLFDGGVQTVFDGQESEMISKKGEVLVYPYQGLTVRIE